MIPDLSTKDLAWFCRLGRFMAGHDMHPDGPLKVLRPLPPESRLDAAERRVILEVLDECDGRAGMAAKKLGISRNTMYDRLRKWGYIKPRNLVKLVKT